MRNPMRSIAESHMNGDVSNFLPITSELERSQMASNNPETALEAGAGGGTLAIVRQQSQRGTWEYVGEVDDFEVLNI
jgi:hypothetical protein